MMWDPSNPYNITKNSALKNTGKEILTSENKSKPEPSNPYDLYQPPGGSRPEPGKTLGLSGSFDVSRGEDAFSQSKMMGTRIDSKNKDPKEATILTQIEEETAEASAGQQKLLEMWNDLSLPEY